ncbi:MAG: HAMP domain-containing methyl-accepting chemotaxis protein [Pseudobdellovibrionaceae bacterium]
MRVSLRLKLIGAFLLIVCTLPMVGGIGLYFSKEASKSYSKVAQIGVVGAETSDVLQSAARDLIHYTIWLALPGNSPKEIQDALEKIESAKTIFQNVTVQLNEGSATENEKAVFKELSEKWSSLVEVASKISTLSKNADELSKAQALEILHSSFSPAVVAYSQSLGKLSEILGSKVDVLMASTEKQISIGNWVTLGVILGGFMLALVLGIAFSNSLSQHLNKVASHLFTEAESVHNHSDNISDNSQKISDMTNSAVSSLLEISASIDKISKVVQSSLDNTETASVLSRESSDSALLGEQETRELITSMMEISEGSKRISSIISLIDEISFQTNILALNAAVEAARAGEHGKGFAVVADSVRMLAQKSAEAAKEISTLVDDNVMKIDRGVLQADKSGRALQNILQAVQKVAKINAEIASTSKEQALGIMHISQSIKQIDSTTQDTAAASENMVTSAGLMYKEAVVLSEQATLLKKIIDGESKKVDQGAEEKAS